jgi:hypothetical protein
MVILLIQQVELLQLHLPATPSAGDIVAFQIMQEQLHTNNITLARNGSKIGGTNSDALTLNRRTSSYFCLCRCNTRLVKQILMINQPQ